MAQVLKEEIRQNILRAAASEFLEHGYQGSSMRNIARAAGITAGNLYRYYESKDSLYEAIIREPWLELNRIIGERTNHLIRLSEAPSEESIHGFPREEVESLVQDISGDVARLLRTSSPGILILLQDDREDEREESRYAVIRWLRILFGLLFRDRRLARYLAFGFMESIIRVALEEEDPRENIEKLVRFYLVREDLQ